MHFKTAFSKTHLRISPSKNAFKKTHFKIALSKYACLKLVSKKYFVINASIKAVKAKIDINKNLTMYDYYTLLGFWLK